MTEERDLLGDNIYHLLLQRGSDLFAEFIMSNRWDVPKPTRSGDIIFYPEYFRPYVENYERPNERLLSFRLDYKNRLLKELEDDYPNLEKRFSPNMAGLSALFVEYFDSKLRYLKKAGLFALQLKYVDQLITMLIRALPLEITQKLRETTREQAEKKREEDRRLRDEAREREERYQRAQDVRYFTLKNQEFLEVNVISEFNIEYPILKDFEIGGITFNQVSAYEAKIDPLRKDKYFRDKRILLSTRYMSEFNRAQRVTMRSAIRMNKLFTKRLIKFQDSIIQRPKRR